MHECKEDISNLKISSATFFYNIPSIWLNSYHVALHKKQRFADGVPVTALQNFAVNH